MKTSTSHDNSILSTVALTLVPSATLLRINEHTRHFVLQRPWLQYCMLNQFLLSPFWPYMTFHIASHIHSEPSKQLHKSQIWQLHITHTCTVLSFLPVSYFASGTVSFQLSCYRVAVLNNSVSWLKTVKYKHCKSTCYARHFFISYGA